MKAFDLDSWHEVFATLRKNKLRTLMTASGVFWGIFMLVLMLGFGRGLETGVRKSMIGFVSNSVYVWGQRTSKPFKGFQPGRRVELRNEDIGLLERGLPGLAAMAPRVQLGGWREGNNVTHQQQTGNFSVMGDVPSFAEVEQLRVAKGRFINDLDMAQRRKVCVIGEQVRSVLFGDKDGLGETLQIRGIHFRVVGVFRSSQPGEQGDRANNTLHVPFSTFQAAFNAKNVVGWFGLLAERDTSAENLEKTARALLARQHGIAKDDANALGSFNAAKMVSRVSTLFTGIQFFVWFVGVATLAAGTLGVSNIMLISVRERTVEFGVRKALGATPASVVSLVLQEAALLTALSGYAGLVVGVLTLEGLGRALAGGNGPLGPPQIDLNVGIVAACILAVVGVLAGIAPARRAAAIRPVEALRAE